MPDPLPIRIAASILTPLFVGAVAVAVRRASRQGGSRRRWAAEDFYVGDRLAAAGVGVCLVAFVERRDAREFAVLAASAAALAAVAALHARWREWPDSRAKRMALGIKGNLLGMAGMAGLVMLLLLESAESLSRIP